MDKPMWQLDEPDLASGRLITARCQDCGGTGRAVLKQFTPPLEEDCGCLSLAESLLSQAHFPERFRGKTLAQLEWERLWPTSLAAGVQSYAEQLESYGAGGLGMVLFGAVGNGKTHIAVGLGKLVCALGHTVAFATLADVLEELRASYDRGQMTVHAWGDRWAGNPLGPLFEAEWLILDDLGLESDTAWVREKVYQLINRRWLEQKPTIVTTNKTPDELARRFGEGVVSRLWGDGVVLNFQGEDYRLSAKPQRLAAVRSRPAYSVGVGDKRE